MKKDIPQLKVQGVQVVIARKENGEGQYTWEVYLINQNNYKITDILVQSSGYGTLDGEVKKTSVLRHFIEEIQPLNYALIEPIDPSLFVLNNQFWVSFYIGKDIYDKKFIFLQESIVDQNIRQVPILGLEGVVHG